MFANGYDILRTFEIGRNETEQLALLDMKQSQLKPSQLRQDSGPQNLWNRVFALSQTLPTAQAGLGLMSADTRSLYDFLF
jgi:hypothetical protein